ncbi:hypothetical protein HPB51_009356 [Rhipicephalus microplus]|uniref:Peptidase M13 N-terminal domain-containing protein n=1 Tax=Rhipicephalus microplus TaxID=6941 RepID=A0A9J6F0Y5_RHIMP|nr:hypothetical protein HPB51_009356 [Rhipicephalus microplus]
MIQLLGARIRARARSCCNGRGSENGENTCWRADNATDDAGCLTSHAQFICGFWERRSTFEQWLLVLCSSVVLVTCVTLTYTFYYAREYGKGQSNETALSAAHMFCHVTQLNGSSRLASSTTTARRSCARTQVRLHVIPRCRTNASSLLAAIELKDTLNLNRDPCKNFYEYACSLWSSRYPIPDDMGHYSVHHFVRDEVTKKIFGNIPSVVFFGYTFLISHPIIPRLGRVGTHP